MIEITNLAKRFGAKCVFENADIRIESGSICGLVGINGAGKSTLLRIMSGVLRQDAGEVRVNGRPVYDNEEVKAKIFFLPDEPFYTTGVSGNEIRELYSTFYSFDDQAFTGYVKKFSLDTTKPIRNFSKGMKRQLFIAAALACRPEYLFLDEAFDGLDPLARLEFKRGLIQLQEEGSTVVIASHSLRELEDICDSFILIDENTVKMSGNIESALSKLFKLQIAFAQSVEEADLPFPCVSFEKTGRVITLVARGDKESALSALEKMHPLILDEIPMDFEDLFISEVQERGYLK